MAGSAETVQPPLDDVMLSMDVVDTLRQDARIVDRELNDETRRDELIERLRQIYRGQGIEVPDHILEQGVQALEDSRFVYEPPKPGLMVWLATAYVTRWDWGKWAGGGIAVFAAIWLGWQAVYVWPQARKAEQARIELSETLPDRLSTAYETVDAETDDQDVLARAAQLRDAGHAAAKAGQLEPARKAAQDLTSLLAELRLAFDVQIVSRSGELSGLWRIPRVNPDSRNYYLVVEALDEDGNALEREILNEETGKRETVMKWAVRVPKSVFDRVQDDKLDDGIIQNAVIGEKRRGELETDWRVNMSGGALTQW
ncbi:MAG: tetratricopeptide repeat protein [Hyphomicrobiales bacterium]|nr:tetratricopeptide repeat protein [Hyphomicrobiales bacterium]